MVPQQRATAAQLPDCRKATSPCSIQGSWAKDTNTNHLIRSRNAENSAPPTPQQSGCPKYRVTWAARE